MGRKQEIFIVLALWTTALVSGLALLILLSPSLAQALARDILQVQPTSWKSLFYGILFFLIFAASAGALSYVIFFHKGLRAVLKQAEVGRIDVSMHALENIALNAARTAQAGMKSAHASARLRKDQRVDVYLDCSLYSDVEIPSQMGKIQERIKKDIERYTGLPVAEVILHVEQVETVGTKVER